MKKVLLSAFACDPTHGSEPGNGWSWAIGLAREGFEVHCLTRYEGKEHIEANEVPLNLIFHYVKLPWRFEKLYALSQVSMYGYYVLWQWQAYRLAKSLHKEIGLDIAHHVTWGSVQLGSFMYKLPIPFIFGPAGGGQQSPLAFRSYFGESWSVEEKREKVSKLLLRYNPACKKMFSQASAIWVSNPDTAELVRNRTSSPVYYTLDAALSPLFFPKEFKQKNTQPQQLRLLWVGRFMPRKGVLLLLEVMEKLKEYKGIKLSIVGDGEQRDLLLASIKNKNLQESVTWKGKVSYEEVKGFYSSHDAFFFTSLRDSCPAQLIEAMAYGMPVVTLNLHGQAIIVSDETGFRCSSESPEVAIESLTQAILTLYNNASIFASMSKAAHSFALKQTWENKIKTIVAESYPK
jgi:glycosyltransferase involved in cell wall biosynthesis